MAVPKALSVLVNAFYGHLQAFHDEFISQRVASLVSDCFEHVWEVDPFVAVEKVATEDEFEDVVVHFGA